MIRRMRTRSPTRLSTSSVFLFSAMISPFALLSTVRTCYLRLSKRSTIRLVVWLPDAAKNQRGASSERMIGSGTLLTSNQHYIVAPAAHHGLPAIYPGREEALDGGMMSDGATRPRRLST